MADFSGGDAQVLADRDVLAGQVAGTGRVDPVGDWAAGVVDLLAHADAAALVVSVQGDVQEGGVEELI